MMSIAQAIAKLFAGTLLVFVLFVLVLLVWLWPSTDYLPAKPLPFHVERVIDEPIVHVGMSPRLTRLANDEGYVNVNGPSLIRAPEWIDDPLGTYYLYFSHHKGDHIRLAYSDRVEGPWTIHERGTLALADSMFPTELGTRQKLVELIAQLRSHFSIYVVRDMLMIGYRTSVSDQTIRKQRGISLARNAMPHIASPDVVVDETNRRLVMYFHGLSESGALFSRIATSINGIDFDVLPEIIPSNYLRAFEFRGDRYVLGMPGVLYRSKGGVDSFLPRDRILFDPDMRHAGLWIVGDILYVFWSRVGDSPEAILVSEVDLSSADWDDWRATAPQELMRAELSWEGGDLEALPSLRGELEHAVNELRDPFVYVDPGGEIYLLYVGAGEQAIGLARIRLD